ncbi:uncharacterized protein LOC136029847 [Artemia franciscana]|uniref:uncharacterized protein LOC136029847 n=1 Tax=Artemia franciscana TaxID=6661 RepID=UPI0032DA793B
MEFRSSSLNNLHPYRRRQESICLSGDDSPLDLSVNTREINRFRLSKLKLHRSSSQYSHYRSSSPTTPEPLSLHNSPRILSRESSAESLFENGVTGVSLSCPVTPTKDRKPFEDFRRVIAAKRRVQEQSKLVDNVLLSPLKVDKSISHGLSLNRSISMSCDALVTETGDLEEPSVHLYQRTTSLMQANSRSVQLPEDLWDSLISQSESENLQDTTEGSAASSSLSRDSPKLGRLDSINSENNVSSQSHVRSLKVKFNGCYTFHDDPGGTTEVTETLRSGFNKCPSLSPLRVKSLLTAEERHQEKRKRNNEAAKKSRKNRRYRELAIIERLELLEEENRQLKLKFAEAERRLETSEHNDEN